MRHLEALFEWLFGHPARPISATVVCFATLFGFAAWYEHRYPCVRYEQYRCTTTSCAWHDSDGHCASWVTSTSTCSRCLERKTREEPLPSEAP